MVRALLMCCADSRYQVKEPKRFVAAVFDVDMRVPSIEEWSNKPKARWAVTGLHFYDNEVT